MTTPKVFISYSHDSQVHADKVLAFSNKLRSEGIDSTIDQYVECPSEGWPRWMEAQIAHSDYVLIVCTHEYCRRVMEKTGKEVGLGVFWEGGMIYQSIYNAAANTKFIPVLFSGNSRENIPTPLQSTTTYRVDVPTQYERLYRRLLGTNQEAKPPLGKPTPLPPAERKTDVGMFVTGFIDLDLWNKAKWTGTIFMHDEEMVEPPYLGILFKDEEAAIKIFEGWHKRIGKVDEFNEMRVTIAEGDIEGEQPGYSVYISANPEGIYKRAEHDGIVVPQNYIVIIGRMHRMNPLPGANNLKVFKTHYERIGSYYLMPSVRTSEGHIKTFEGLRLLKRNIQFRTIDEIKRSGNNDLDSPILKMGLQEEK